MQYKEESWSACDHHMPQWIRKIIKKNSSGNAKKRSILLRSFQTGFLSVNLKNPGIRYRFFFYIYINTRVYIYINIKAQHPPVSPHNVLLLKLVTELAGPLRSGHCPWAGGTGSGAPEEAQSGISTMGGQLHHTAWPLCSPGTHRPSTGPPPSGGPSPSLRGNPGQPPKHLHVSSPKQRSPSHCRGWLRLLFSSLLAKTRYPCVP